MMSFDKISKMQRAYHYIPLSHYKTLQESDGILKPNTPLVHGLVATVLRLSIPKEKYLFSFLDTPEPESWVTSGWLNELKIRQQNRYALVSFDVSSDNLAYVLNGTELYGLMETFGLPKSFNLLKVLELMRHYTQVRRIYNRYINSKTPLRGYQGNFDMHELICES